MKLRLWREGTFSGFSWKTMRSNVHRRLTIGPFFCDGCDRVLPEEETFLPHKDDGSKRPQFTDVSVREVEIMLL